MTKEIRLSEKDYLWLGRGLRSIGLFEKLDLKSLATILPYIRLYVHPKGSVLCREGESGDKFFLIYKGKVDVLKRTGIFEGKPVRLAVLGPGQFFGEMSLLLHQPRAATCVAAAQCLIFTLHFDDFRRVVRRHKSILAKLKSVAMERMRGGH